MYISTPLLHMLLLKKDTPPVYEMVLYYDACIESLLYFIKDSTLYYCSFLLMYI